MRIKRDIKDDMPVYFELNCLHLTSLRYLGSEFFFREYEKLPVFVLHSVEFTFHNFTFKPVFYINYQKM